MAFLGRIRIKRAFLYISIFALGLLLLMLILWKPPAITSVRSSTMLAVGRPTLSTWKEEMKNLTLKRQPESLTSKGLLEHLSEKEVPALDDLLQILQTKLQNYSGRKQSWTHRKCRANMTGQDACYDTACPAEFSPSLKNRLQQVLSARTAIPAQYLRALASAAKNVTSHKYIFVTGASSNHYKEMQALLYTVIHVLFPLMKGEDYTLVVYNLGLNPKERELTEKHCRCTFIDFPFSVLPDFAKHLKCFVWKPLVVASLLEKAEVLVWMDASIRWRNSTPVAKMFSRARASSFLAIHDGRSIAVHSQPSMAKFFGDQICQYAPFTEIQTGIAFYSNDRFMREAILPSWLSCAFDRDCQCVQNHSHFWGCSKYVPDRYGTCHRFEQSSLGMMLSKLFLEYRPMLYIPRGDIGVARGDGMNWFESG